MASIGDFFEEKLRSVEDGNENGNGNAPVKFPSFKAPKPSFNDGGKHSLIDVCPFLVKEAAFSNHVIDTSLVEDLCTISVLPDEGSTITQCTSLLSFVKALQKVLQRQASLNTDKVISERCHDAVTNRWRRYKRVASFDSRKIIKCRNIDIDLPDTESEAKRRQQLQSYVKL